MTLWVSTGSVATSNIAAEPAPGQVDRLEVAAARLNLQGLEIQTGALEQVDRHVALDPGLHRRRARRRHLARTMSNCAPLQVLRTVVQP